MICSPNSVWAKFSIGSPPLIVKKVFGAADDRPVGIAEISAREDPQIVEHLVELGGGSCRAAIIGIAGDRHAKLRVRIRIGGDASSKGRIGKGWRRRKQRDRCDGRLEGKSHLRTLSTRRIPHSSPAPTRPRDDLTAIRHIC